MALLYLGIIKNDSKPGSELSCTKSTGSYSMFTRPTVEEFMTVFAKTVAERTPPGQRQDVEEQGQVFHVYARTEGVAAVLISKASYPKLVAHQLLSKALDEFLTKYPRTSWQSGARQSAFDIELKKMLEKAQDPSQVSGILKVQQELDETKIVLHKTIESVLERGEKLDTLVAKSEGLSATSRGFYQSAKKQNSCCTVM